MGVLLPGLCRVQLKLACGLDEAAPARPPAGCAHLDAEAGGRQRPAHVAHAALRGHGGVAPLATVQVGDALALLNEEEEAGRQWDRERRFAGLSAWSAAGPHWACPPHLDALQLLVKLVTFETLEAGIGEVCVAPLAVALAVLAGARSCTAGRAAVGRAGRREHNTTTAAWGGAALKYFAGAVSTYAAATAMRSLARRRRDGVLEMCAGGGCLFQPFEAFNPDSVLF